MSKSNKKLKKSQLKKKVIVDLKNLKSLDRIKELNNDLNEIDGEEIKGGKDDEKDTVNPQWPTTGGIGI